jgi:uncharacterized repeat protein (TIGR02543 family)
MEGLSTNQNLAPYAKDLDNNPITFDISLPINDFTAKDSIVTVSSSLKAGMYYLKIVISDGELLDTGIVLWTVFAMQSQHAVIRNDSAKTIPDSQIVIDVLANDFITSGTLVVSTVSQPDKGLAIIKENKVTYIPASGFSGVVTFDYIVNALDTGHIIITVVSKTTTPSTDHTPPLMKLKIPAKDSISVNASSATVTVEIRDESGIDTVMAILGTVHFQTSVSESIYTITADNLVSNQFNTIKFIARDASGNNNVDTLFVTVKYDPTMSDETGPVIKQISGPNSGSIVTDPLVTIIDSITDPSGIDSVFYRLNNSAIKLLTAVSDKTNQFSLTDSLKRTGLDTIQIIAVDKSSKWNRSVQTIILNYVIPPVITVQPVTTSEIIEGQVLRLSVVATGTPAPLYQWYKDSVLLSGQTTFELIKAQVTSADAGTYHVIVSNGSGTNLISTKSSVTVKNKVKITEEPQSKESNEGGSTTFTIKAEGDAPLLYLWLKNDTAISGANTSTYTLSTIKATDDKSTFKCVVSNGFSKDTSTAAVLTVITTPVYKVTFSVDSGTAIPEQSVKQGGKVTKPATNPSRAGFEFGGWYTNSTLSTEFDFTAQTVTSDVTIYAKWTKTYTLTLTNYPTIGGTVSKSPNITVYTSGTTVTITATANSGYRFKSWTGDHSSSTNSVQITMTKDYTITANFLKQYTVNFSSNPSGKGSVTTPAAPSAVVDSGVALDIVASPANGFKFKKWTSINAGVSFVNSTSATTKLNITQDISTVAVQAVFGCVTFRKDLPTGYRPNSVVQSDDGSYGVYCHLNTTTGDGVIIKLNANGDSVWEKTVCHLGILDESYPPLPIHKITNGFMAGLKAGSTPIYGISLDANSTPLFAWDPSTDFNINYSVQNAIQTRDGGYFLAGYEDQIYHKQMLIKTDVARKKVWMMYTDTLYGIRDCQQTLDNGFIMTDGNYRVVKINNTGTIISFSIKFSDITPNSVCQISETNGYLIGGGKTYTGAALIKLNSDGTTASDWPKIYRTSSTSDEIVSVRITSDGNFIFLTGVGSLFKTNSIGEIIWEKKLANNGGKYMELCKDGGFIILTDTWVMKTDENGDTD